MEIRRPQPANFLSNLFFSFLFRPKGSLALLRCEAYATRTESLWGAVAVNGVVVADIPPEEVKTGRMPLLGLVAIFSLFILPSPTEPRRPLLQLSAPSALSRQPPAAP